MFKSIRTKIFVSFALLTLAQLAALSFFFGRIVVRETETYILDSLARRAENQASQWTLKPEQRQKMTFVSESLDVLNGELSPIRPQDLRLVPRAGDSFVTSCQSNDGRDFLCAFAYVPSSKGWVVDATEKTTTLQILTKLSRELAWMGIILLIVTLLVTFAVSRLLLNPLKNFADAAKRAAEGHDVDLNLPLTRTDEIGQFASAFHKMLGDLREREKKIAHSARLASIGQMGASIAHEVKNPLTSMLGYAKVLSRRVSDPEAKEAADIIASEADRCGQILGQMLRFSRTEATEKKPFALKEVIQSTLALVNSEAKSARIEIQTKIEIESVLVGNPQQIQQVILNILVNAIHASKDAMSSRPEAKAINLRAFERDGFAVIEIEDHGAGIPIAIKDRIFDPFFTTKDKKDGTGLGLSVALELVHDHSGGLYFQTLEGVGTIFTIELPLPLDPGRVALRRSSDETPRH